MRCKAEWAIKFLEENFGISWVIGTKKGCYRDHQKNVILNREKSRIPETLEEIPRVRFREETKEEIKKLIEQRTKIRMEYARKLKAELKGIDDVIADMKKAANLTPKEVPKTIFICPCPKDKCKGLIELKGSRCCLCNLKVCKHCRAIKENGKEHRCSPEDVDTMKLLLQDTKPCPKCATNIYRISGCSQMWCTQCHTAFNWNTGKVDTGNVHNPHAIEWRRQHGNPDQNNRDIPCGELIPLNRFDNSLLTRRQLKFIQSIYQVVAEGGGKL